MNTPEQIEALYQKLVNSNEHRFPVRGRVQVSNEKGVYIIYDENDIVLHVGSTPRGKNGINQRLYNHITGSSSFSKKHLQPNKIDLRGNYKFRYIEINDDARLRGLLEHFTIGKLCPLHFGTGE